MSCGLPLGERRRALTQLRPPRLSSCRGELPWHPKVDISPEMWEGPIRDDRLVRHRWVLSDSPRCLHELSPRTGSLEELFFHWTSDGGDPPGPMGRTLDPDAEGGAA